jgi:deoxyribodipyrimidine photo-lyase
VGADAAPYFRFFNPVAQGEKFDPAGCFVRRWAPELVNVPTLHIHAPWHMSAGQQASAHCRIGVDYPAPLVDHQQARERALAAYQKCTPKRKS